MPRAWSDGSRPRRSSCWTRSASYEIQRDERIKLLALPLWQIDSLAGGEEREPKRERAVRGPPAADRQAPPGTQAQLERQIALLRHVEALRLYAAGHDGKLPARLSDISVPLPVDPFTGKPFVYTVEGTTAHLRGGSLPGEEHEPRCGVHYEVTMSK